MEKFFTPGRSLLLFALLFLAVWAGLQYVIDLRLTTQAKLDGQRILNWSWPSENIRAKANILNTEVVKRTDNDAVVKIKAHQIIEHIKNGTALIGGAGKDNDCQAILTYYKTNRFWYLGKVEMH